SDSPSTSWTTRRGSPATSAWSCDDAGDGREPPVTAAGPAHRQRHLLARPGPGHGTGQVGGRADAFAAEGEEHVAPYQTGRETRARDVHADDPGPRLPAVGHLHPEPYDGGGRRRGGRPARR